MLIVALVAGFLAAYAIKSLFFVENERQAIDDGTVSGLTEQLLVANGDLSAGTELNALNVRLTLTPEEKAPRDGIFSFNGVSGRKIARDLKDGEPVSLYDLEESEQEESSAVGFVPPGCSIVPIIVNSATKENGNRNYLKTTKLNRMIKTGDVVDVLVVKEIPSKSGPVALPRLATEPVAENVSVFDVSDESRFGADGASRVSTISALLTAEQLDRVRAASEEGKIRVVLRNEGDEAGSVAPSDFAASENVGSVRAYYPPFEEPRKTPPLSDAPSLADENRPFVISLPDDAQSSADGANNASDALDTTRPVGVVAPEQGLINNDFMINLKDDRFDLGENPLSLQETERVPSPAKWNVVDFNAPVGAPEETSSLQDALWLGALSFRPRLEPNDEERQPEQYERAVSEDLTADVSETSDDLATDVASIQDPRDDVASNDEPAHEIESELTPVASPKKFSPFLTVTSKRETRRP